MKAKAKKKKAKGTIPVVVPSPPPAGQRVAYLVRDWHLHDGTLTIGYTFDQSIAVTYIGQASPRGGRYYVGLVLQLGAAREIGALAP